MAHLDLCKNHITLSHQINKANGKKMERYSHNFWREGSPEKLAGMDPLRMLFDKSLHRIKKSTCSAHWDQQD